MRRAIEHTCAKRLDQVKVLVSQHLGAMPNNLGARIDKDLIVLERSLLDLPLQQPPLLLLSRCAILFAIHVRFAIARAAAVQL